MNYPTNINIRGYDYDVHFLKTDREVDNQLKEDFIGQIGQGQIRISINQQPFGLFDTFIHEILHGLFNRNQILRASIKPEIGEEAFIDSLATDLANLIIKNEWITLPEKVEPTLIRIHNE